MSTLTINAVPYPISLGSNNYAPFSVAIPAGSTITSGNWICSGWSGLGVNPQISTASGAVETVVNGSTAMSAGQISDFNAAVGNNLSAAARYSYYQPVAQQVYIQAELTGTFPPPPSLSPSLPAQQIEITHPAILASIKKKEVNAMSGNKIMTSNGIYIYAQQDISNLMFPIAYQFKFDERFSWLTIGAGLVNLGGSPGNSSINMRIHKGVILQKGSWQGSPLPADNDLVPVYTGLFAGTITIPWNGDLYGYMKFTGLTAQAPANSQLEFIVIPFNI